MSNLEEQIRQQRMLLDGEQPRAGHEERFRQKLDRVPVRRMNLRYSLQIAASVAVLIASGIFIIRMNKSGEKQAVNEIPAVIHEADAYFASQVDTRFDQIREFDFLQSEEKTLLLDELKELENHHEQLMTDLKANPDDERVINALIRHYQMKLEVMDQIIQQLNQIKNTNITSNENTDI